MKKTRADAKKIGPLKLAALNGLSLSRLPLPDEGKEVSTRATNDERVSVLGPGQQRQRALVQFWGMSFLRQCQSCT